MLSLRRGTVEEIVERHVGLVRLRVGGRACVAYPGLTGPVCVGDDVVVNVQAVELGLGSGGFDVLLVNLTRGLDRSPSPGAHVMALPYTPLQHARRHVEEEDGERVAQGEPAADADGRSIGVDLTGLPVVCCSLHSQLVPAACGLAAGGGRAPRVAYLQVGGGALPVSLSDSVRALRLRRLVEVAIAVAPCVDGDLAATTAAAALAWTRASGLDAAIAAVGPGIVGTGSPLGHGAVSLAEVAHAAIALGARPLLAARLSTVDRRQRHRGLSHHTTSVLRLGPAELELVWPEGAPIEAPARARPVDATGWQQACEGLPLESMGRGPDEEPWLFGAAFAAGRRAAELVAGTG